MDARSRTESQITETNRFELSEVLTDPLLQKEIALSGLLWVNQCVKNPQFYGNLYQSLKLIKQIAENTAETLGGKNNGLGTKKRIEKLTAYQDSPLITLGFLLGHTSEESGGLENEEKMLGDAFRSIFNNPTYTTHAPGSPLIRLRNRGYHFTLDLLKRFLSEEDFEKMLAMLKEDIDSLGPIQSERHIVVKKIQHVELITEKTQKIPEDMERKAIALRRGKFWKLINQITMAILGLIESRKDSFTLQPTTKKEPPSTMKGMRLISKNYGEERWK